MEHFKIAKEAFLKAAAYTVMLLLAVFLAPIFGVQELLKGFAFPMEASLTVFALLYITILLTYFLWKVK